MDGKFYVDHNGSLRTITWKDDDDDNAVIYNLPRISYVGNVLCILWCKPIEEFHWIMGIAWFDMGGLNEFNWLVLCMYRGLVVSNY